MYKVLLSSYSCEVEVAAVCCGMLQSCFVAFFSDAHNAKRALDFIQNMRASAEVSGPCILHIKLEAFGV